MATGPSGNAHPRATHLGDPRPQHSKTTSSAGGPPLRPARNGNSRRSGPLQRRAIRRAPSDFFKKQFCVYMWSRYCSKAVIKVRLSFLGWQRRQGRLAEVPGLSDAGPSLDDDNSELAFSPAAIASLTLIPDRLCLPPTTATHHAPSRRRRGDFAAAVQRVRPSGRPDGAAAAPVRLRRAGLRRGPRPGPRAGGPVRTDAAHPVTGAVGDDQLHRALEAGDEPAVGQLQGPRDGMAVRAPSGCRQAGARLQQRRQRRPRRGERGGAPRDGGAGGRADDDQGPYDREDQAVRGDRGGARRELERRRRAGARAAGGARGRGGVRAPAGCACYRCSLLRCCARSFFHFA